MATLSNEVFEKIRAIEDKWIEWSKKEYPLPHTLEITTNRNSLANSSDLMMYARTAIRDEAFLVIADLKRSEEFADYVISKILKYGENDMAFTSKKPFNLDRMEEYLRLKARSLDSLIKRTVRAGIASGVMDMEAYRLEEAAMLTQANTATGEFKKIAMNGMEVFRLHGVRTGAKENPIIMFDLLDGRADCHYEMPLKDAVKYFGEKFWDEISGFLLAVLDESEGELAMTVLGISGATRAFGTPSVTNEVYKNNPIYGAW